MRCLGQAGPGAGHATAIKASKAKNQRSPNGPPREAGAVLTWRGRSWSVSLCCGGVRSEVFRRWSLGRGGAAHGGAVPLLATPAQPFAVDEAGAGSAAAFVFVHGVS